MNKAKKTVAVLQHGFKVESDRVQSHDPTSGAHIHPHAGMLLLVLLLLLRPSDEVCMKPIFHLMFQKLVHSVHSQV